LGLPGTQVELLKRMSDFRLNVFGYKKSSNNLLNEFLLRDFHMVGSGYDISDSWEKYLVPKTSEEKKSVGGGAKLTYRFFIQNMAFACILEIPSDLWDILLVNEKRKMIRSLIVENYIINKYTSTCHT
jgi:CRISPR system Cascade subunit CasD